MRHVPIAILTLAGLALGPGCRERREVARLTFAPEVPPPIHRRGPAIVEVHLEAGVSVQPIAPDAKYRFWSFNGHTPGPFLRARVGDTLELHLTNTDGSGMPHNIDLHAVTGPGGGATATVTVQGDHRIAWFKLLHPGIFVYHCAAPPVMDHISNGMYGMILVEPKEGLPHVDREFYVLQSEIYAKDPAPGGDVLEFSHEAGLAENPRFVVFNGRAGALVDQPLEVNEGEKVRIYFGNIGPNKISSFHVIGTVFDKVYREGDLTSPPARDIQTTLVPAGGATAVELTAEVPGEYTLVDHAIFRVEKGAVGFLKVSGDPRPDIYRAQGDVPPCKNCKVHH